MGDIMPPVDRSTFCERLQSLYTKPQRRDDRAGLPVLGRCQSCDVRTRRETGTSLRAISGNTTALRRNRGHALAAVQPGAGLNYRRSLSVTGRHSLLRSVLRCAAAS